MGNLRLLFFATLKEKAGTSQVDLQLPDGSDVAALKQLLVERYPQMAGNIQSAIASINQEFAFDEDVIPDHAEVGLFPPVSGGSREAETHFPTILEVTYNVLDLDDLLAKITLPTTGAACVFTGMVRGSTRTGADHQGETQQTAYLEYEAYIPMAQAKMQQVADEIRSRWPSVEGIAIVQRIGRLEPMTPTVLIACTAGHRDTGVFEASRYGIDRLKEIVPVWKKEIGPDGQAWVEGGYKPTKEDR